MESEEIVKDKNCRHHHGHAVKRLRQDKRMSQADLGKEIGMVQSRVCYYESLEKISDDILERFAKVLNVSVDFIKEMEEDKPLMYYIENNTVTNENNTTESGSSLGNINGNSTLNNHIDKSLYTALEQMQKLYESSMQLYNNSMQLYNEHLKSTEEKISTLEKEISRLKEV
ncbi:helix-turn-helix domain-containing protein [Parabacteroides pacaensis]|uniref:helix-turn-helix domain-containing protein n=1 Tax=Parabacteroides pacaensis TaxID=2086575 RepID=UPI000D0E830E|nr:helix-turn-helix transcriptional regulator [Parabacteroides pacaensis]